MWKLWRVNHHVRKELKIEERFASIAFKHHLLICIGHGLPQRGTLLPVCHYSCRWKPEIMNDASVANMLTKDELIEQPYHLFDGRIFTPRQYDRFEMLAYRDLAAFEESEVIRDAGGIELYGKKLIKQFKLVGIVVDEELKKRIHSALEAANKKSAEKLMEHFVAHDVAFDTDKTWKREKKGDKVGSGIRAQFREGGVKVLPRAVEHQIEKIADRLNAGSRPQRAIAESAVQKLPAKALPWHLRPKNQPKTVYGGGAPIPSPA
jgi:hypothetical protein